MLDLLRSFSGAPAKGLQYLALPSVTLLLYPSVDTIVILNAADLQLVQALAFWEVFPGAQHSTESIGFLAVDPAMKLIVASMGSRVAAWSLSGFQTSTWRVHSSLTLSDGQAVTALNCRSGLLALGSNSTLSVYTLILENDLPTWSNKWTCDVTTPSRVRFSPSLMYIATSSQQDNIVRIYLTTSGRQTQTIPHPRPLANITWRHAQASSRDDLILYTITTDTTLRIFFPVLDSPQHVQLHASLDLFSSLPPSVISKSHGENLNSSVFWLDREVIGDALGNILKDIPNTDDAKTRRVSDIKEEGWDLFLRVLSDGSIVVRAVANIDRRPPTLLKQFTLLQSLPSTFPRVPSHLYVIPNPGKRNLTLVTSPPLATLSLEPLNFFDARSDGLILRAQGTDRALEEESRILGFVRTPEGQGLGVVRECGGEAWFARERGSKLVRAGHWPTADLAVVLDGGRYFATYSKTNGILTLHSTIPQILAIPPISSLFSLPPSSAGPHECIFGITSNPTPSILHMHAVQYPGPTLELKSQTRLPLSEPALFIVPVDPMAWSGAGIGPEHDVLLSVARGGELMFWVQDDGEGRGWRLTGRVRTGRTGISRVRCSSAKKSVLVVPGAEGEELTIWDSKESEFASGLEYRKILSAHDPVNDLDWSSTPDNQSILAVGFERHVEILCQQRMTYFDEGPGWGVIHNIDIGSIMPHPISDSIWLSHGSLLIGSGHQMCLFGQPRPTETEEPPEGLFEHVARLNGPLVDYHPQMILQCLLWGKLELVKEIIVNLFKDLTRLREAGGGKIEWTTVPLDHFLRKDQMDSEKGQHRRQYTSLFASADQNDEPDEEGFSRALVEGMLENLEEDPLPHLTPNEHAHLLVLIQATLEVDESRRALDANGLRYLISMRSFFILNQRTSAPNSPRSKGEVPRKTGWRARLRFRDMLWAFHSESQGLLLSSSSAACQGKMLWSDARALGVFIWLNSYDSMKAHMEVIARNEYMAGEARDPVACSLFYFALGKHKLVHGLWRQAAWHKEQAVMLKFLSNDFSQARWRTAALKNAYALLSKRRFEYAAAFFLLGGSLKDAVNVCIRQLDDFQLAVALARLVEGTDDGPILQEILNNTVIPLSFRKGNRWLGSWAFWLLHRRDLAVRILVTPLQDIASSLDVPITDIGSPHYDDPSLALLFSQLKSKTLQTAKGTSEISGRVEFNFVLQIARVFTRMGCHVLALDLVRSWSFDRPSTAMPDFSQLEAPAGVRRVFPLEPAMRRRSSIMIDMDVSTAPPTRRASPERDASESAVLPPIKETPKEENDLFARKAGLGSLMKSAKQDVQVPEFDMSSFF
ncbi:WD repeat-containing protein [Artomyces pyxidatus]|uniref:WD repeat-containing protein n=1 Tax=Artomyces pyxidatus TaxID=48021 RepID=A0ACB8TIP8_9AGAM|nr:WD repeat-containing protein [Artomyces pyxidatus]